MYIQCTSPGYGQISWTVWLASSERHHCSNEGKTRNPLKFAGVPETGKPFSAASGPKFAILWGHVEEILLFNRFFQLSYMPSLQRNSPTKLCDGAQMANFLRFFASCRWRPLFNAANFGWCSLLECRAVTLPSCETCWNLLGCPNYRTDLSR